jgi:hypothetical protein
MMTFCSQVFHSTSPDKEEKKRGNEERKKQEINDNHENFIHKRNEKKIFVEYIFL